MINRLLYKFGYKLFKLLCKKEIKKAWDDAEYLTRKKFFDLYFPNNLKLFNEAYYEVWIPLYDNYIK